MKCPECVKNNQKSTVRRGSITCAQASPKSYYDEEGMFIEGKVSGLIMHEYICSNGHVWYEPESDYCWYKNYSNHNEEIDSLRKASEQIFSCCVDLIKNRGVSAQEMIAALAMNTNALAIKDGMPFEAHHQLLKTMSDNFKEKK